MKVLMTHSGKTAFGKNLVLKLWPKMRSANLISVFFYYQYLIIGLTSDFDFLHEERHECKQQSLVMGFLKKFSAQTSHFGPKNGTSSWLWICSKNFFEILRNERDQGVHGTDINGFPEKNCDLGQMSHFVPKIAPLHNSGYTLRIFDMKNYENYVNGFSEIFFLSKWVILDL